MLTSVVAPQIVVRVYKLANQQVSRVEDVTFLKLAQNKLVISDNKLG